MAKPLSEIVEEQSRAFVIQLARIEYLRVGNVEEIKRQLEYYRGMFEAQRSYFLAYTNEGMAFCDTCEIAIPEEEAQRVCACGGDYEGMRCPGCRSRDEKWTEKDDHYMTCRYCGATSYSYISYRIPERPK